MSCSLKIGGQRGALVEFHILGPVGLRLGGRRLELGSDKERALLAALMLDVGRPVSMDALMDRLWDGEPPPHARENAHTYISRVRRQLRPAGTGPGAPRITSRAHTYVLETDPDSVDWYRFQRLTDLSGTPATRGDDERIVELLTCAEGLWQGRPSPGSPGSGPRLYAARWPSGVCTPPSPVSPQHCGSAVSRTWSGNSPPWSASIRGTRHWSDS